MAGDNAREIVGVFVSNFCGEDAPTLIRANNRESIRRFYEAFVRFMAQVEKYAYMRQDPGIEPIVIDAIECGLEQALAESRAAHNGDTCPGIANCKLPVLRTQSILCEILKVRLAQLSYGREVTEDLAEMTSGGFFQQEIRRERQF